MNETIIQIWQAAFGKPTMTRRDKWKQRDCVMEYRRWCDTLREYCPKPPAPESIQEIIIEAQYGMPSAWSAKKQAAMLGTHKRTKPDGDNIAKAICDALWKQDQQLGDIVVRRRWARIDLTTISISSLSEGGKA